MLEYIAGAAAVYFLTRKKGVDPSSLRIPKEASPYLKYFVKWAQSSDIPLDVLMVYPLNESNFTPSAYNPEVGVMLTRAKTVALDSKWAVNAAWHKAKTVYGLLSSGDKTASEIAAEDKAVPFSAKLWTFGSYGLFQIGRISAAPAVGYSMANEKMFDIDTNCKAATSLINYTKNGLGYSGSLTDDQWGWVRAGYAMGINGMKAGPTKAKFHHDKFLRQLAFLRGQINEV